MSRKFELLLYLVSPFAIWTLFKTEHYLLGGAMAFFLAISLLNEIIEWLK